jgi:hypothetical protein
MRDRRFFYPPTWQRPSKQQNDSLLPGKVQWLHRQYHVMFLGTVALATWYIGRSLLR